MRVDRASRARLTAVGGGGSGRLDICHVARLDGGECGGSLRCRGSIELQPRAGRRDRRTGGIESDREAATGDFAHERERYGTFAPVRGVVTGKKRGAPFLVLQKSTGMGTASPALS